jgi:DNA-binding transcriptional ArsR family regulator
MLLSKANLYPESDQKLCNSFKGLTHPSRTRIIRTLRAEGELTVQQLASHHPLTLGAVSQHLEIMRNVNFLTFRKHSPFLIYALDEENFKEFCDDCFQFLIEIQGK